MGRRLPLGLIITFLLPACSLYAFFVLYPMVQALYVACFRWRGVSLHRTWVGLSNFRELLLSDPLFWIALKHNLAFLFIAGAALLCLGMFFAVALAGRVKAAGFFRVVYLFPHVMSVVAIAVLWSFIYHPTLGLVTGALKVVGLERFSHAWLGESGTALWAIMIVYLWYSLGFYVTLFSAGVHNIPRDLHDAAAIDGCSAWQSFYRVTLPLLRETVKLAVVFLIIGSLNIFGLVYVMVAGQVQPHSEVMLTRLYYLAFTESNYGVATALGVVMMAMIFALSLLSLRLLKREVVEF